VQVQVRIVTAHIVAVLAVGCGSGDNGGDAAGPNEAKFDGDNAEVAAVVDRLTEASRDGEPGVVCGELFTEELAERTGRVAGSCEAEVQQELVGDSAQFEVEDVRIEGDGAVAKVIEADGDESLLRFEIDGGEWRIARISTP
jgi:hypothetical protein